MSLLLSDEEAMLASSARTLLQRSAPVSSFRARRDEAIPVGFDQGLWQELVAAGLGAPQLGEQHGGLGMGFAGAGIFVEEIGRSLATTPFQSTAMAIELLLGAGDDAQRSRFFPGLLDGTSLIVPALDELPRHDPAVVETVCRPGDGSWIIAGQKRMVLDASSADALIVSARCDGDLVLVVVRRDAPGAVLVPTMLIDSRDTAMLRLDSVRVEQADLLTGAVSVAIDRAHDVGRVLLAAELLGMASEVFERTIAYLKERRQFGQLIGAFQALQHRCARLHIELEMTRGTVLKALRALDGVDPMASDLASLAKAYATRVAQHAADEAVQLHGGIGMTDELDIGLFLKRIRVAGMTLGDDLFHAERLAERVWQL